MSKGKAPSVRLPPFQEAAFKELVGEATKLFRGGGPRPFEGERVAGFNPDQLASFDLFRNLATNNANDFASSVLNAGQFLLNPANLLNPENIPGLKELNQNVADVTLRALKEGALPGVRDLFSSSGQFGSSRQAIAEGQAIGRAGEAIAGQVANNNFRAFQEGLGAFINALQLAPQIVATAATPAQFLSQIGLQQQSLDQLRLDAARQLFQEQQLAPFTNAQLFQGLINGNLGAVNNPGRPSLASQILGTVGSIIGLFGG